MDCCSRETQVGNNMWVVAWWCRGWSCGQLLLWMAVIVVAPRCMMVVVLCCGGYGEASTVWYGSFVETSLSYNSLYLFGQVVSAIVYANRCNHRAPFLRDTMLGSLRSFHFLLSLFHLQHQFTSLQVPFTISEQAGEVSPSKRLVHSDHNPRKRKFACMYYLPVLHCSSSLHRTALPAAQKNGWTSFLKLFVPHRPLCTADDWYYQAWQVFTGDLSSLTALFILSPTSLTELPGEFISG